jgi:hypothetical protein
VLQIITKLVLKLFPPDAFTASTFSKGVAGLDHEFWDDTVEDHAFEVPALGVTDKVLGSQRRLLREQPDVNVSECRMDRRFIGKQ